MAPPLLIGQVLYIKFRFNNNGEISPWRHPYLVHKILHGDTGYIAEIIQFDSLTEDNNWVIYDIEDRYKYVPYLNPKETVISKDSYAQFDNKFTIELFKNIRQHLKTPDLLSLNKLNGIRTLYEKYHREHEIDPCKIVHMTKEEFIRLNPNPISIQKASKQ